ncbi:hypothetical protein GCWU000322_00056 [Eubacterium saphenum ATCC 49989]|nr:hypothetical protein GCWU000322_00056 [Eubacterium saphenum ATCC 49989]
MKEVIAQKNAKTCSIKNYNAEKRQNLLYNPLGVPKNGGIPVILENASPLYSRRGVFLVTSTRFAGDVPVPLSSGYFGFAMCVTFK